MKGERVAQLELLLRSHPEGLRRAEIARRLGVHRSTISRYVEELSHHVSNLVENNNLIRIEPSEGEEEDKSQTALSVYEAIAFNLSAEALLNSPEGASPHLASGLRKMAINMRSYAPKISDSILVVAEKIDRKAQKLKSGSGQSGEIFDILVDAWISGRMVRINTTEFRKDEVEMSPYFIGFSDSDGERNPITVTGRLRHSREISTIDISKIKSAVLLDQTYTIPDNLKPFNMASEQDYDAIDMIPLKLRLREKSAMNAFFSVVHRDIEYSQGENGSLICTLQAENSIELMKAIFQCGTSVEILEPLCYKEKYLKYLKEIEEAYKEGAKA